MNKKLLKSVAKFQKDMQKICDRNNSGIKSMSISFPSINDKEIVIAERKATPEKEVESHE